jgi:sirohydrochlorin cobaltochelatase
MTTALILAGHGSHISPHTAGLVWRHADRLRLLGAADEVTAAFWKEMPSFARVLETLTADEVTVIPLFTAQGYFTQTVIPAEMGLSGPLTERDGRRIRCTPSLAESDYLTRMVDQRVDDALRDHALNPAETAVAVIGHSTRRSPESRRATERQAERLRARGQFRAVVAVYLDDDPDIPSVYACTDAPALIAIPYFLAAGSHTTIDVPDALGLEPGASVGVVSGRRVVYTPPVGTEDGLLGAIVALAEAAGLRIPPSGEAGDPWQAFPAAGRAWLTDALEQAWARGEALRFGGLALSRAGVCAAEDAARPAHTLHALNTPAAVRAWVREPAGPFAPDADAAPFRFLATAAPLPGGWFAPAGRAETVCAIVETVYPGVVAWAAAEAAGTLRIAPLAETAARQTGIYRALGACTPEAEAAAIARVCARCVCAPRWARGSGQGAGLPCPEPCNVWLSAALEPDTSAALEPDTSGALEPDTSAALDAS